MRAIGWKLQLVSDGVQVHDEQHGAEQSTLHCRVQQRATSFIALTEAARQLQ